MQHPNTKINKHSLSATIKIACCTSKGMRAGRRRWCTISGSLAQFRPRWSCGPSAAQSAPGRGTLRRVGVARWPCRFRWSPSSQTVAAPPQLTGKDFETGRAHKLDLDGRRAVLGQEPRLLLDDLARRLVERSNKLPDCGWLINAVVVHQHLEACAKRPSDGRDVWLG